ncbi:MAG TPA: hypothetical protein PKD09_09945 [Aggregatilinea sp.]|jgi:cytochrome c553|uniref:hypothetical protein n=1 Tax=Aggregatilinea sp. TaxID=2806333 RepID=UPI002C53AE01|nr:hypothetical protein [Aggregatilinea sp.]HML21961.1 hypothetical protein [Aggregatilinea sp.]
MLYKRSPFLLSSFGLVLILTAAVFWMIPSQPAAAQCGSQASSCKSCHEVQGEMPVNSDGTGWHESHAFGDFCYICHAGNQQATDMDAAHTGMVDPLSDINASCQMCHADDLDARAQVYADELGIDLASLSSGSGPAAPAADTPAGDTSGGEATVDDSTESAAPSVVEHITTNIPANNQIDLNDPNVVDYVERYDEIVLGKHPTNWGNIVLAGLIGLMLVGGGGFVVYNEMHISASAEKPLPVETSATYPADVVDMLPALARLKVQTRQTLRRIIENPKKADKVIGLIDSVVSDETEE